MGAITAEHVKQLAQWAPDAEHQMEIPFVVSRVVLQDFTGRALAGRPGCHAQHGGASGQNPKKIEPLVPVDLVVNHSIMVDHYGRRIRWT